MMMLNKVGAVLLLTKERHCILSPIVMFLNPIALKLTELKLNELIHPNSDNFGNKRIHFLS